MNHFTKNELIALEDAMQHMVELNPPYRGVSPLLNKIQSMIDNYCEHEWGTSIANSNYYPNEKIVTVKCLKCSRNPNE